MLHFEIALIVSCRLVLLELGLVQDMNLEHFSEFRQYQFLYPSTAP